MSRKVEHEDLELLSALSLIKLWRLSLIKLRSLSKKLSLRNLQNDIAMATLEKWIQFLESFISALWQATSEVLRPSVAPHSQEWGIERTMQGALLDTADIQYWPWNN